MISFTIPGAPRGKGRPRFRRAKGFVATYSDPKTANYENLIAYAAQEARGPRQPLEGPLVVTVLIRLAPPTSASKRIRAAMLAGEVHPTKRPDLDNVIKAVLDGCNGVAFADDAQVCWINAGKVYAETAGVDVTITSDVKVAA